MRFAFVEDLYRYFLESVSFIHIKDMLPKIDETVEKYDKAEIAQNSEKGIYNGLKKVILNYKKTKKEDIANTTPKEYDNSDILEKIEKLIEKK